MGLARYVVDAVVLEGRSPADLAARHGISRSWIYALVARYHAGGYDALEPRSRRPHRSPNQVAPDVEEAIVGLRLQLGADGFDNGPATIAHHLAETHETIPSVASIWRVLHRRGLITPEPKKRPRSSLHRFEADLPNELWQADTTHWHLADGGDVEILNVIDDHSRFLVASDVFITVKAADVVQTFYNACNANGFPACLLTDNGAVFTGRTRKGKVLLESELERLGIECRHSSPYHPQTCGKVERFHQTLKRYLTQQPPAATLALLQAQLDTFRAYYNQRRPHRARGRITPLQAFSARLIAGPATPQPATHFRVRHDHVDRFGRLTIRYLSRLHHIGIGTEHAGEPVHMLVANKHIRVIREDGSLLRELVLDPSRDYQPTGKRPGRKPRVVLDDVRHASTMT